MTKENLSNQFADSPRAKFRLDKSRQSVPNLQYTDAQRAVIEHEGGPLLVAAGPGTGKTAVLAQSIAARIQAGVPSSAILVFALSHTAATEIKSLVTQRCGGGLTPSITTFHSFAFQTVQEFAGGDTPVLLKAAEQEVVLKEILQGLKSDKSLADRMQWPADLTSALATKAIVVEVRNAIARAQSLGISADQLYTFATGSPEWQAIANILREYLDTLDAQNQLDYNELIFQLYRLSQDPAIQPRLQARFKAIYIDEYQDADPMQIQILRNLMTPSTALVAFGDTDQAVYGFRGAAGSNNSNFPRDFADFGEVHIKSLDQNFRSSDLIQQALNRVIERNANLLEARHLGINPRAAVGQVSELADRVKAAGIAEISVDHYESAESEAQFIAAQIRELVLGNQLGFRWSDVAVLVRSGSSAIPTIERALIAADIPVQVVFDEVPLAKEPVVRLLLDVLRAAINPATLKNPQTARNLLTSQLVGFSAVDIRLLGRALKKAKLASGLFSEQLIADAVADVEHQTEISDARSADLYERVRMFHDLLQKAHNLFLNHASAAEILWTIWEHPAHDLPGQLRSRALGHGYSAAYANHALDAVRTLFKIANEQVLRFSQTRSVAGFIAELESMDVASTKSLTAIEPNAVSLMTAHRAKGSAWPIVFVASVDEGSWPDVSKRRSLFAADRLRLDGLGEAPERHEVITQERRLFYVACARAGSILRVSSTSLDPDSGRVPSRFLMQISAEPIELEKYAEAVDERETLQSAQFSLEGLVAQLRRVALDEDASSELRSAAVARLTRLAKLTDSQGRALAAAADPANWWGVRPLSENSRSIVAETDPIYVRGSSFQDLLNCPLNWFMKQQASADVGTSVSANFGSVVHAIAAGVIDGELEPAEEVMRETLDSVWQRIRYSAAWQSDLQKVAAMNCLNSFLKWREGRLSLIRSEQQDGEAYPKEYAETRFNKTIDIEMPNGAIEKFKLTGSIDILQVELDGKVYVADIKTSSTPFSQDKTEVNPQLGIYQTAVQSGAVLDFPEGTELAGADLLFVRSSNKEGLPATRSQPALNSDWMKENIQTAINIVRSEDHTAVVSDSCDFCPIKSSCPTQPTGKWVM